MKLISGSVQETARIAQDFLKNCVPKQKAFIVGLSGDLGSGKTTFTQQVAKALGIEEVVTSPTFVLEKIYKVKNDKFDHLIHIDAYRLEKGEELLQLGWHEIAENPRNLILIEWPEKVADILPSDIAKASFTFIDQTTRKITLE